MEHFPVYPVAESIIVDPIGHVAGPTLGDVVRGGPSHAPLYALFFAPSLSFGICVAIRVSGSGVGGIWMMAQEKNVRVGKMEKFGHEVCGEIGIVFVYEHSLKNGGIDQFDPHK